MEGLKEILLGLVAGVRAVSSIMLLMFVVIFLYAIAGRIFFGENDPVHFGSVAIGMLSLFQANERSFPLKFKVRFEPSINLNQSPDRTERGFRVGKGSAAAPNNACVVRARMPRAFAVRVASRRPRSRFSFEVATLASWSEMYRINYFGCDRYTADKYVSLAQCAALTAGDDGFQLAADDDAYALDALAADGSSDGTLGGMTEAEAAALCPRFIHASFGGGRFYRYVCAESEGAGAAPVTATFFFFTFTVITAFVILSLFISVITQAMFEVRSNTATDARASTAVVKNHSQRQTPRGAGCASRRVVVRSVVVVAASGCAVYVCVPAALCVAHAETCPPRHHVNA